MGPRDFENFFGAEGAEKFYEPQAKFWFSNIGNVLKTIRNERGTRGEPQNFPLRGPADVCNQIRGWYASVNMLLTAQTVPPNMFESCGNNGGECST